MTARAATKIGMSDEHKAALARGREQSRTIRRYLEALAERKPRRGRKVTLESLQARLKKARIDLELAKEQKKQLKELQLIQLTMDLEKAIANFSDGDGDFRKLETEFITVVEAYSISKGISYETWREVGVSAEVLASAGMKK